jgi:4-hydroxy-tetrahydrodipicolinate synthase
MELVMLINEQQLKGIYVPVVTPFDVDGELDLDSLQRQVARLLAAGIHGLVVNGTTGESPTVTADEVAAVTAAARKTMGASRIPLVLGTGSNSTAAAVKRTEAAGLLGADAALVVVPYYSRPSQQGIVEHFRRVSDVGVPVIVYDIPHRTGVRLEVDTVRTIMQMEGVIGLKDSTGNTQLVAELSCSGCSKPVWCGDDELLYASLCCGARGGMLASANVYTEHFVQLFDHFSNGRLNESKLLFDKLLPLIRLLFSEPNPAPFKWLLARQGVIGSDQVRLPMTQISPNLQQKLQDFSLAD